MSNRRYNEKPKVLNLKAPRDPNPPTGIVVLRTFQPEENFPCHVGSGECLEPAIESHDDGSGGEFFVCATHLSEVKVLSQLVNEMSKAQMDALHTAIKKAE